MKHALALALVTFSIFAEAKCYDSSSINPQCRYPDGDQWCRERSLPPYAYLDKCEPLAPATNTKQQQHSSSGDPDNLMPVRISLAGLLAGKNSSGDKGFKTYVELLVLRYAKVCGSLSPAAQALSVEVNLSGLATFWNLLAANMDGKAPGIRQLPGQKKNELLEPLWILSSKDRDAILAIYAENAAQAVADAQKLVATLGCQGASSTVEALSQAVR